MQETAPAGETQRYQLAECIGRGGLGSVHRAWDARLGRWVAVKRLTVDPALSAEEIESKMRREANALAALQHPNIVTVHDFGTDEDGPYVVMELIEGRTLDALADDAPFDYASFLELAGQSLAGIGAAHRAGLLHRDLKPGNVMLANSETGAFQVKLLDFGLAKFAPKPMEQTVDQANELFGSIYFMAPEQFGRGTLDARTDLYALGCIFYYALTSRHPFAGVTVAETMASHLQHTVRDLGELRPDLPKPAVEWVMRLMSLVPDDRPASAAEALAALRAIAGGGATAVPTRAGARKGLVARSSWLAAAAAGILLTGCLAAGAWFLAQPRPAGAAAPQVLPLVSLVADTPAIPAKGSGPGSFTLSREGSRNTLLVVTLQISGSAKNGVDYEKIPPYGTIKAGEASSKIMIVPIDNHYPGGKRHVRLTLLPSDLYRVDTIGEVKMNIVYDRP